MGVLQEKKEEGEEDGESHLNIMEQRGIHYNSADFQGAGREK